MSVSGNTNPDPAKFELVKVETVNGYAVVQIKYPDCKNYEGVKIMVWKSKDFNEMLQSGLLDPHFSDDVPSCLARFIPTKEGWNWAVKFAESL